MLLTVYEIALRIVFLFLRAMVAIFLGFVHISMAMLFGGSSDLGASEDGTADSLPGRLDNDCDGYRVTLEPTDNTQIFAGYDDSDDGPPIFYENCY